MFGITPNYIAKLYKAIEEDNLKQVQRFLEHVPLDMKYEGGINLVRLCVEKRSIKSLTYVLEQGVDPNIKTNSGQVSIVLASAYGDIEAIKELVKHNANMDVYGVNGMNGLLCAAERGYLDIVQFLVEEAEANIDVISSTGETAEEMARIGRKKHVLEYLKQYREAKEKPLLLQYEKEYVKPMESNDNSVRHYWTVTDHQEITRIANKCEINRCVTQIFNFEARSVLTIVENISSKAESILKESFEDVAQNLIDLASSTYEEKTDEKVASQLKQAQPWSNLNKDSGV